VSSVHLIESYPAAEDLYIIESAGIGADFIEANGDVIVADWGDIEEVLPRHGGL
jgi:hypothetical protein